MSAGPNDRVEPMSRMTEIIADHMVLSRRISPHVHSYFEIDYSRVDQVRAANRRAWEEQGVKVGAAEIRENLHNTDTTAEEVRFAALGMFLGICLYYFLSTTIHPWYLSLPLILSIFTKFRFAMVWSIAAFLSYSAYVSVPAEENLWLVALEYLLVFGYMGHEIFKQTKNKMLKAH